MSNALQQVLTFGLIPVLATVAGGVIASFYTPGPYVRSAIQHFAAGVVFAAVATELLPDVLEEHALASTIIGFALGVIVMFGIKWIVERSGQKGVSKAEQPTSLMITAGVDFAIDGLLIGIGFAAAAGAAFLLTLALSIEALFLSLSVAVALGQTQASSIRIISVTVVFALLLGIGAVVGATVFRGVSGPLLAAILSFGAAALLYLVTEELLADTHGHHVPENPLIAAMFFVGFLLVLIIELNL